MFIYLSLTLRIKQVTHFLIAALKTKCHSYICQLIHFA